MEKSYHFAHKKGKIVQDLSNIFGCHVYRNDKPCGTEHRHKVVCFIGKEDSNTHSSIVFPKKSVSEVSCGTTVFVIGGVGLLIVCYARL